ncbi:hypothetical protein PBRA_009717, partial [Plasmodiophora brassicae]
MTEGLDPSSLKKLEEQYTDYCRITSEAEAYLPERERRGPVSIRNCFKFHERQAIAMDELGLQDEQEMTDAHLEVWMAEEIAQLGSRMAHNLKAAEKLLANELAMNTKLPFLIDRIKSIRFELRLVDAIKPIPLQKHMVDWVERDPEARTGDIEGLFQEAIRYANSVVDVLGNPSTSDKETVAQLRAIAKGNGGNYPRGVKVNKRGGAEPLLAMAERQATPNTDDDPLRHLSLEEIDTRIAEAEATIARQEKIDRLRVLQQQLA